MDHNPPVFMGFFRTAPEFFNFFYGKKTRDWFLFGQVDPVKTKLYEKHGLCRSNGQIFLRSPPL